MRRYIFWLITLCSLKLSLLFIILKKGFDPGDEGAILYLSGNTGLYPGYLFAHYLKWLFPANPDILDLRKLRFLIELITAILASTAVVLALKRKATGVLYGITIFCFSFLGTYLSPYGKTAGYNELNLLFILATVNGYLLISRSYSVCENGIRSVAGLFTGLFIALAFFCKPISAILVLTVGLIFLLPLGLKSFLISLGFQTLGCIWGCICFGYILPADVGILDCLSSFQQIISAMDYTASSLIKIYMFHDLGLLISTLTLWMIVKKAVAVFKLEKRWQMPVSLFLILATNLPFMPEMAAKIMAMFYILLLSFRINFIRGSVWLVFFVPIIVAVGSNSGLSGNILAGICCWTALLGGLFVSRNTAEASISNFAFYCILIILAGVFSCTQIRGAYLNPEPLYTQNFPCPACENMELSREKCIYFCELKNALHGTPPNSSALLANYNPGLAYLFKLHSLGCPYIFMDGVSFSHNARCLKSENLRADLLLLYDKLPEEVQNFCIKLQKKHSYRHVASIRDPYSGMDFRPQTDTIRIYKMIR